MLRSLGCAFLVIGLTGLCYGEEFGKTIKGKVQIGVHNFDVSPDYAYVAHVTVDDPMVDVGMPETAYIKQADFRSKDAYLLFSPVKASKAAVVLFPSLDLKKPVDYTLQTDRYKLGSEPSLEVKATVDEKDRTEERFLLKEFPLKLRKDRVYVFEVAGIKGKGVQAAFALKRDGALFADVPAMLSRDAEAKSSRIVWRATVDGSYKLKAGAFAVDTKNNGPFPFTLKVYECAKDE